MQQHVKFLVVEDVPVWSTSLTAAVRSYFEDVCRLYKARVLDDSAIDGNQGYQRLKAGTYDLVTLDMNLGAGGRKSKISGLDLLGRIADGNRAFFVIIITGAVTDPSIEQIYGKETAALMRFGALNEAVKKLPAERVRILHKPDMEDAEQAMQELLPHLHSALDQYCEASLQRNIFRPRIRRKGSKTLWEIRFNGGERRTYPEITGFEIIRSALSQPNREMKIIRLMRAICDSSGQIPALPKESTPSDASIPVKQPSDKGDSDETSLMLKGTTDAKTGFGIDYSDLTGMSVLEGPPVHVIENEEGAMPVVSLIGALLDLWCPSDDHPDRNISPQNERDRANVVKALEKEYGDTVVLSIYSGIGRFFQTTKAAQAAQNEFGTSDAIWRLNLLRRLLHCFVRDAAARREKINREDSEKKWKGASVTRLTSGTDTLEAESARQQWRRVWIGLQEYGQHEFVSHIKKFMKRGLTAKGHINYHFDPEDGFPPFWLTELQPEELLAAKRPGAGANRPD